MKPYMTIYRIKRATPMQKLGSHAQIFCDAAIGSSALVRGASRILPKTMIYVPCEGQLRNVLANNPSRWPKATKRNQELYFVP